MNNDALVESTQTGGLITHIANRYIHFDSELRSRRSPIQYE